VGFTISFSKLPVRDVITAIVIQAFLAVLVGQLLGRKARAGSLRISTDRITNGSRLAAGSVLVALSAVLLVGPPVVTRVLPHILPHHRVGHYVAPPAVSSSAPWVESGPEASGFLVVPLVFKTSERRAASLAGSIPVRLRHQH
jgi:hypothetical protein